MVALSPVPEISISLAPPEVPQVEPFSPFMATGFSIPTTPVDQDAFRPLLLSPPATASPRLVKPLSPLRPSESSVKGQGLERERFEELLKSSKERNAVMGGKRSPDLRKEIALKVHKNKQLERRALFLSKVQAPPSPGATLLPKTPPESPAIFHYSLPSPGLHSPLSAFATEDPARPRDIWVEQVDFRLPEQECIKPPPRSTSLYKAKRLPSLDQITAHLSQQAHHAHEAPAAAAKHGVRLPAFLKTATTKEDASRTDVTVSAKARPALPAGVGRLHFPIRSPSPPREEAKAEIHAPSPRLPPSPSPRSPKLQVRTTVVPRTSSFSPVELTENNLRALDLARERTAHNMLTRLRRRTVMPDGVYGRATLVAVDDERKLRRHSAPPELPLRERVGFVKPVLDLPGAF